MDISFVVTPFTEQSSRAELRSLQLSPQATAATAATTLMLPGSAKSGRGGSFSCSTRIKDFGLGSRRFRARYGSHSTEDIVGEIGDILGETLSDSAKRH